MAFVSPCNSHCPCLSLGHELIYIEGWTVSTALALAKITQPLDNGNHLFSGPTSLQSCFPPTWAPGCTTGPSSPPGLPFLYLKGETQPLKRTHKNLSYVAPHTLHCPCHLLLATPPAPIDSCTLFFCPLQVLSQLQALGALCVTVLHTLFPLPGFWVWEYTDYTQSWLLLITMFQTLPMNSFRPILYMYCPVSSLQQS